VSYARPVAVLTSFLDRGMKTELCCLLGEEVLKTVSVLGKRDSHFGRYIGFDFARSRSSAASHRPMSKVPHIGFAASLLGGRLAAVAVSVPYRIERFGTR